eukprot:CAMPEP_0195333596 /NCGR_PEP_ID=MMETSP0708-20121125/14197_1 /TAXON_ID=33640 /ORGANISM="Asterionellopsis glacialis, Strain CCMP134" /LENGTH=67 /DNA_ID=CAMNT_0040403035 /DNA_START=92 /DNA_END=291 /DNA_ORIENTATION=-
MARNIDHIINAASDPVETVFVALTAITGEIIARICRKVSVGKPLMVTIDRAHLAGPAIRDDQIAFRG